MRNTEITQRWLYAGALLLLAACGHAPKKNAPSSSIEVPAPSSATQGATANGKDCSRYVPAQEDPSTRGNYTRGGLYKPGVADTTPSFVPDLDCIAEPSVRDEPHSQFGNNTPYAVLGKKYKVLDSAEGYVERGTASYYGNKFHGRLTSNHEVYDMYAFTAAHKTLPLPSFARITNLDNGKSVIVRVNDRGPFHDGRLVDLSYAAAVKLGITAKGTGNVEVRGLTAKSARADARQHPAPAVVQTSAADVDDASVAVASLPAPAAPAPLPATMAKATVPANAAARVQLQVASFSNHDNAERALGKLRDGGIDAASLSETQTGAGTRWRLRVDSDETGADALAQRIKRLGFELPQRVKD